LPPAATVAAATVVAATAAAWERPALRRPLGVAVTLLRPDGLLRRAAHTGSVTSSIAAEARGRGPSPG